MSTRRTQFYSVILGLGVAFTLVAAVSSCYWQPNDREARLAIEATVPNLMERRLTAAEAAGTGPAAIGSQEYSGAGLLTAYVIEESYLRLDPEELERLFRALEDAQDLSQEEIEQRFPSARIRVREIDFAVGTIGSVDVRGLKGDATYVVAVFADSCDGESFYDTDGYYDCDGLWYEALDFRRVRLPAGETTRVSLSLDAKFDEFAQFLFDQYGYEMDRYDEEHDVEDGDEDTHDEEPEIVLEPGDFEYFEVYASDEAVVSTLEYSDGTNSFNINLEFKKFAWEYRGSFIDAEGNELHRFHFWWYSNDYSYNQDQPYVCEEPLCPDAAGRLELVSGTAGAYYHGVVFMTAPERPGIGNHQGAFATLFLPTENVEITSLPG
ncbi:MAG: hypothetical protein EA428_00185, partial [Spirochaetaceae bacterium]